MFSRLVEIGIPLLKLSEIADTASGGTPDRNTSSFFGGSHPWLKSGELNDGLVTEIEESITDSGLENSSAKVFPSGTLLIALYGATVGKTGILGIASATNQAVCAVMPKTKDVRVAYLHWFFRHKREDFLQNSFGGAQPNISQRILRDTVLPVPSPEIQETVAAFLQAVQQRMRDHSSPLPELPALFADQRRIVVRIEELAAKIEEARILRQQSAEQAAALSTSVRRSLFGETPGVNWVPLKQFVADIENGKSPQCEPHPASEDEWGVLKVGAVSFGSFDEGENKALPVGLGFDPRYEVRPGDFLMSRANTTELVGACAIVARTRSRLLLSDKVFRFHFQRDVEVLPQWLDHAMKSPVLRYQIERGASGTSPTMKNISKEKVLRLLLPRHALPEQQRIVAGLDDLQKHTDALKALQAETSAELDALMPSILDKAFRGEL